MSFSSKYRDPFPVERIANGCVCQVVDMTSASRPSHNITSRTRGRDFSAFGLQNEISCVPVDDVSASSTVTSYLANHIRTKIICSMASSRDCASTTGCRQCLQNPRLTNLSRRMCSIAAMALENGFANCWTCWTLMTTKESVTPSRFPGVSLWADASDDTFCSAPSDLR